MGSRDTLIMFDNLGKNCPLNILRPMRNSCLQYVIWGGGVLDSKLSNKITFFHYGLKE